MATESSSLGISCPLMRTAMISIMDFSRIQFARTQLCPALACDLHTRAADVIDLIRSSWVCVVYGDCKKYKKERSQITVSRIQTCYYLNCCRPLATFGLPEASNSYRPFVGREATRTCICAEFGQSWSGIGLNAHLHGTLASDQYHFLRMICYLGPA
jgi:hypothetical protein